MELIIKKFGELTLEELYQIVKLRIDVFVVEQTCPYPELDNKDQKALHLFLIDNSKIVSVARVYERHVGQMVIGRLATHPDYRNKGLAKQLIEESMSKIFHMKDIETIYLQAQAYLKEYYGRFGFVQKSEPYLEDGILHIDMEYLLDKA